MSTLLAQVSSPPPEHIKLWLEVFFYILGGVACFVGLLVGIKNLHSPKIPEIKVSPQPIDVREAISYATKPELNALENRLGGEIHQLHGRVSGVRSELGEKIDALEQRIDEIPHRVITLLKDLKEYHKQ